MRRRVRVAERARQDGPLELRLDRLVMRLNDRKTVGREADLKIGVDPLDSRVSRHAVTITATERGWNIVPTNRNGVELHLWAQPSRVVSTFENVLWPRVGVRIVGKPEMEHWVLLEDDEAYTRGAARNTTGLTEHAPAHRRLTPLQLETVRMVFRELLAWPPRPRPQVLLLKQAATRMGDVSTTAIRRRLDEVVQRAREAGFARQNVEVTEPEYLFALVRAGQIEPSSDDLFPPLTGADHQTK